MANNTHKITITLEGSRKMLELFLDTYEKSADLYDVDINLKHEGIPREMWDFGNNPNTSILQHYYPNIKYPIENYFRKLDKK